MAAPFFVPRKPGAALFFSALLSPHEFATEVRRLEEATPELADHALLKDLKAAVRAHPFLDRPAQLQALIAAFCPSWVGADNVKHCAGAVPQQRLCCSVPSPDAAQVFADLGVFTRLPTELAPLACAALKFACNAPAILVPSGKWRHYVLDITKGALSAGASFQVQQPKAKPWAPPSAGAPEASDSPFFPALNFRVSVKLERARGPAREIAGGVVELCHFFPAAPAASLEAFREQYRAVLSEHAEATRTGWKDPALYPTILRGALHSAADEVFEELQGCVRLEAVHFYASAMGRAMTPPPKDPKVQIELVVREEDVTVSPAVPSGSDLVKVLQELWTERSFVECGTAEGVTGRIVVAHKSGSVAYVEGAFPEAPVPRLIMHPCESAAPHATGKYIPPSMRGGVAACGGGVEGEPQQLVAGMGGLALAPAHAAPPLGEAQEPPLQEKTLSCRDCSLGFPFSVQEQGSFKKLGYPAPVRCPACRGKKKKQSGSGREVSRGGGGGGGGRGRW